MQGNYGDWDKFEDFDETKEEFETTDAIEDFTEEKFFLQKFDRILSSNMKIHVNNLKRKNNGLEDMNIAFADMLNMGIHLNFSQIYTLFEKNYSEFLMSLKGFNNHELAHLLFTTKKMLRKNNTFRLNGIQHKIFNWLEDCRIENLFSELYPSITPYFSRNVSKLIALLPEDEDDITKTLKENKDLTDLRNLTLAFILTYGRKFYSPEFPAKAKKRIAEMFEKENVRTNYFYDIKKVEEVLDTYIQLEKFNEQVVAVIEMSNILEKLFDRNYFKKIPNLYNNNNVTSGGKQSQINKSEKIGKSLKDKIKQKSESFKKNMQKQSRKQNDSKNGNVHKLLKDESEKIITGIDEKLKDEIDKDIKSIMEAKGVGKHAMNLSNSPPYIIKDEDKLMSQRIVTIIRRLRQDMSPHYVKRLKQGNIDIKRVMQNANSDVIELDVFKKFKQSKINRTKMGVAIVIDSSGSMNDGNYELALRSAYCISESLEKTGSKSLVVSFDVNYVVLKKFSQTTSQMGLVRASGGGTSPEPALLYSEKELEMLRRKEGIKNLMVIVISDCEFTESSIKGHDGIQNNISNIFQKFKRKYKLVIFNIFGNRRNIYCSQHYYHKELKEKSNFYYEIKNFDELYHKMIDFVKRYEIVLHREIARWG